MIENIYFETNQTNAIKKKQPINCEQHNYLKAKYSPGSNYTAIRR